MDWAGWMWSAVSVEFECSRCLPDGTGDRVEVTTFGQLPCVHVGGTWEPPPAGSWRAGDEHDCPLSSRRHVADSACVVYAVRHGDRLYRLDAS
jgi:hypothetical protein